MVLIVDILPFSADKFISLTSKLKYNERLLHNTNQTNQKYDLRKELIAISSKIIDVV